ncbi:MAG: glycosyltransferase family 2 protein [Acidothermus sp.]|nr:glycosyltransferase family 2 protein [Acidothermus sp.]
MTAAPRLAIVVVTHDSASVLPDFLRSLRGGYGGLLEGAARPTVIVVDNASTDETLRLAHEIGEVEHLDVHLVALPVNGGYAAGVNAGVAAAGDVDAVLVANPDVRFAPHAIERLWHALVSTPTSDADRVGIVVPRIASAEGRLVPSLRRAPTLGRAFAEAVLGNMRASKLRLGEIITDPRAYRRPTVAAWATGCAMLIDIRCLRAVGPWDESFFLYSEETDFALRARDAGWLLRLEPDAEIVHVGGESRIAPALWALLTVNRVRLYRKRHGPPAAACFRAVVAAREALRAVLGRPTSRAALRALVRGGDPREWLRKGNSPAATNRAAPTASGAVTTSRGANSAPPQA